MFRYLEELRFFPSSSSANWLATDAPNIRDKGFRTLIAFISGSAFVLVLSSLVPSCMTIGPGAPAYIVRCKAKQLCTWRIQITDNGNFACARWALEGDNFIILDRNETCLSSRGGCYLCLPRQLVMYKYPWKGHPEPR